MSNFKAWQSSWIVSLALAFFGLCSVDVAHASTADLALIRNPAARNLLLADGREASERVDGTGAFRNNARKRSSGIEISAQRRAFAIIAASLVASPGESERLLNVGASAIRWGFSQMTPDGQFPSSAKHANNVLQAAMFVGAAARSTLLLHEVNPTDQRLQAVRRQAKIAVIALLKRPDFARFVYLTRVTNQTLFVGLAVAETGKLNDDAALATSARRIVYFALDHQQPDGTLPEKGGFDSNYQSVSLDLLAQYETLYPDSRIEAALRSGTNRLLSAIDPDGSVNTAQNTRTHACFGENGFGKRGAIDALPLRLLRIAAVLNDDRINSEASSVAKRGQRFAHFDEC